MATSHYCNGKWRDGTLADCDRHTLLAKRQPSVYRGVGDPGGRSPKPPKQSGSGGSGGSKSDG